MGTHTVLYIDEIKRGNYKSFFDHVLGQVPQAFTWRPDDEKVLSKYRQALLGVTEPIVNVYCTVQGTANNPLSNCEEVLKEWWVNYVGKPINDDYWRGQVVTALRLFGMDMGIAQLVTMPPQLSALAVEVLASEMKGEDLSALVMELGKLASLVSAFYMEVVVHLMVEAVGTPLSVFMNLASITASQILSAQGQ